MKTVTDEMQDLDGTLEQLRDCINAVGTSWVIAVKVAPTVQDGHYARYTNVAGDYLFNILCRALPTIPRVVLLDAINDVFLDTPVSPNKDWFSLLRERLVERYCEV